MKILILSDSHDNIVRLRHVLGFAVEDKFDAVIHCGDWNTPLSVDEVLSFGIKTYGVLGNADIDPKMVQAISGCEKSAENFLEFELGNKKIGICHYPTGLDGPTLSQEYDVLFCGHTHQKKIETYRKTLIVNPGALHRVTTPSFAVYDTDTGLAEIIDVQI